MRRAFIVVGFVLATAACAEAPATSNATTVTKAETRSCPLGVPGAVVRVERLPAGVALVFGSVERADELRARVHDAAAMFGPGARLGRGHEGKHGEGGRHGLEATQLPPSESFVEDLDRGAELRLTPLDSADREALYAKASLAATRMNESRCEAP